MRRTCLASLPTGAALIGLAACSTALAWNGPFDITLPYFSTGREVGPRAATDGAGNLHVVWFGQGSSDNADQWRIYYQSYNGTSWSTPLAIGPVGAGSPDIAVDASNNLHVSFDSNENIYYMKRTGGVWSAVTPVQDNASKSLTPRLAVNGAGTSILIGWHENGQVGGTYDIMARKYTGGTWEAIENVSSDSGLSRNCNLVIDSAGNFVVAWEDVTANHSYFRQRNAGGGWGAKTQIDTTSDRAYGPSVAIDTSNNLHFTWHDDSSGDWDQYYRMRTAGGAWASGPVNVANHAGVTDCCGDVGVDNTGTPYVVWADYQNIYFTRKSGPSFLPWYKLATGNNKATPRIVFRPSNVSDVLWQDRDNAGDNWNIAWMWRSNPDTSPPSPAGGASAVGQNTQVKINWSNPTNLDFVGVRIRWKLGGFPTGPTDGNALVDKPGARGAADTFTHVGLTNGVTYYYALFAYDDSGNFAPGVNVSAVPNGPADFDLDGDVDQADFGRFQACLTGQGITQALPSCAKALLDDVDADVDAADMALFLGCMSGPGVYANPNCVP